MRRKDFRVKPLCIPKLIFYIVTYDEYRNRNAAQISEKGQF